MNIDGLSDFSRAPVFCDAMKTSRTWGTVKTPYDTNAKITTDSNGWPTQDFGVVVFTNFPSAQGLYQLSFNGKAQITAPGSNVQIGVITYDPVRNLSTSTLNVHGDQLFLVFSNTTGGIQNARLIRPGCADGDTFFPPLLAALKPLQVIRYMDLLHTNDNPVVHWSERNKPTDAHYTNGKGIPWEYAIDLANDLGKDMWINIPAMADDDYVNQLAALFKARLKPGVNIYVEYSNEVWNAIFSQTKWNYDQATLEVHPVALPSPQPSPSGDVQLNDSGTDPNSYYWAWKRVAKRLIAVSRVFKSALGPDRVRPVLSMQIANPTTFLKPLQYIAKYYGDPKTQIYGIAGAPYFSTKERDDVNATRQMLLIGLTNSVESQVTKWSSACTDPKLCKVGKWNGSSPGYTFGQLAAYYGLRKLSYESGSDTHGPALKAIKSELQQSPEMGQLVTRYLSLWYGCGGDVINYFSLASAQDSDAGAWGAYSDLFTLSEKARAVNTIANSPWDALKSTPCVGRPPIPMPSLSPSPTVSP